jgi:hypothetical protein
LGVDAGETKANETNIKSPSIEPKQAAKQRKGKKKK